MIFKVRKLVGLALAITRGWLPEWYLDVAIKAHGGDCICDIPSVPKEGLSLSECRWEEWRIDKERKFNQGDKKKREKIRKIKGIMEKRGEERRGEGEEVREEEWQLFSVYLTWIGGNHNEIIIQIIGDEI